MEDNSNDISENIRKINIKVDKLINEIQQNIEATTHEILLRRKRNIKYPYF